MQLRQRGILLLFVVSWFSESSASEVPAQAIPQSAERYVADWGEMAASLPDRKQVQFFEKNFNSTHDTLRRALSHSKQSVRMRAAYVIGEIGDRGKAAGPDLLARLMNEPDVLVRIYILGALRDIRFRSEQTSTILTKRFATLNSQNVPLNADHSYAEVDEKICVASALYVLGPDESKSKYLSFVTDWLKPPSKDLDGPLLEGYWERRWIAVIELGNMPGANEAIPMLEALQNEPDRKTWVSTQVPRVLKNLRVRQEKM